MEWRLGTQINYMSVLVLDCFFPPIAWIASYWNEMLKRRKSRLVTYLEKTSFVWVDIPYGIYNLLLPLSVLSIIQPSPTHTGLPWVATDLLCLATEPAAFCSCHELHLRAEHSCKWLNPFIYSLVALIIFFHHVWWQNT